MYVSERNVVARKRGKNSAMPRAALLRACRRLTHHMVEWCVRSL